MNSVLNSFQFMNNDDPNDIDVVVDELIQGKAIVGTIVKKYLIEHPNRTFVGIQVIEEV
jgi:hypothetical protein